MRSHKDLRGVPPPEWTRRPRAKDATRARARELREKGLDYEEIAMELGVSKSSISLWVRDMPRPPHLRFEESNKRAVEGMRRYWAAQRPLREAVRGRVVTAAAAEIGKLSNRELVMVGAIAYWCEGAKSKHGCLIICVRLSAVLYQRIEGWAEAVMRSAVTPASERCN